MRQFLQATKKITARLSRAFCLFGRATTFENTNLKNVIMRRNIDQVLFSINFDVLDNLKN